MRIYVTQYGFWWSVSVAGFLALADTIAATPTGWNLDEEPGFRSLAKRPSTIGKDDEGHYYALGAARWYRVLDWTSQDWAAAAQEVRAATTPTGAT